MPIDLTTAPDGSGEGRYRRRSHRHRSRYNRPLFLAVVSGLGLIGVLAAVLMYFQPKGLREGDVPVSPVTRVPVEAEAPVQADSVPATSSKELPEEYTKAKVLSVRRVIGVDKSNNLQIEYEFTKTAETPEKYLIAVSTPAGLGHVAFSPSAARRDVVQMGLALNRLGSGGPIEVWIETDVTYLRVSNVMTIP